MYFTNKHNVPLLVAAWLAENNYDFVPNRKSISATSLMQPTRVVVLNSRVASAKLDQEDVSDRIASCIGSALHNSIEGFWADKDRYKLGLSMLGYSDKVINAVRINPTVAELKAFPNAIPIYIEQRAEKQVGSWTVSGKFDYVVEGMVQDIKTTTPYSYLSDDKEDDYRIQLSLYRWLNPDKITEPVGLINFVFTGWESFKAEVDPSYPQARSASKTVDLIPIKDVDLWVQDRLKKLDDAWDLDEKDIPECSPDELWMPAPKFKYYSDPLKVGGRSTKNFDDLEEAEAWVLQKGKGVVVPDYGTPKRCRYCSAAPLCTQKAAYGF